MEVDKILQEIGKYDFTKENIMDFLMQESKKFSTLSLFKHMLLSITENEIYLEPLIASFYHLEYGLKDSTEEIVICYNHHEVKKQKKDLYFDCFEKIKQVMHEFTNGNSRSFKEIVRYGESIADALDIYQQSIKPQLMPLLEEYESLVKKYAVYDEKMLECRKAKKEARKALKGKDPLVIYEKKVLKDGEEKIKTHTYKLFKKIAFQKYSLKMDRKIEALKKERNAFKENENQILTNIGAIFSMFHCTFLWNAILNKYNYYNRNSSLQEIINLILQDGENYRNLLLDFYTCGKTIQDFPKLCGFIKNGNALLFVCKKIRESFIKFSHDTWDVNVRKIDVQKSNESPYRIYGYQDLPVKMEELSKIFVTLLNEKEQIVFVKKCANFYLDMIIVQPFLEGNIRTSRILEYLMLLTHNILIPSKYAIMDKKNFNYSLYKTYGEVEIELFGRYAHYYPLGVSKKK